VIRERMRSEHDQEASRRPSRVLALASWHPFPRHRTVLDERDDSLVYYHPQSTQQPLGRERPCGALSHGPRNHPNDRRRTDEGDLDGALDCVGRSWASAMLARQRYFREPAVNGGKPAVRCARCGATREAKARFCSRCGAILASTHSTSNAKRHTDRAHSAAVSGVERRQITFLFCDLVGSMALSAELDPEDYKDILVAYRESLIGAIAEFDGRIERHQGDGALICFGYPEAHEDDAERAVRAGLRLIDTMSPVDAGVPEPDAKFGSASRLGWSWSAN
jgi:Adenylate and Guanylate cyclase catalytic domain